MAWVAETVREEGPASFRLTQVCRGLVYSMGRFTAVEQVKPSAKDQRVIILPAAWVQVRSFFWQDSWSPCQVAEFLPV
jgi:hypothetical protein